MSSLSIEDRMAILEMRVNDWRRATFVALAIAILGAFVLPCTRSSLELKSKSGSSVRIDGDGIMVRGRAGEDYIALRSAGSGGPEIAIGGKSSYLVLGISREGADARLTLGDTVSLFGYEDHGELTLLEELARPEGGPTVGRVLTLSPSDAKQGDGVAPLDRTKAAPNEVDAGPPARAPGAPSRP